MRDDGPDVFMVRMALMYGGKVTKQQIKAVLEELDNTAASMDSEHEAELTRLAEDHEENMIVKGKIIAELQKKLEEETKLATNYSKVNAKMQLQIEDMEQKIKALEEGDEIVEL